MKRTFTLFAAILLLAVGAAAQKLSYQAVVRNSANELVYDATVSVSLKILAADGVTVQYAETQTTTTNQNGLLTLIIGEHPTGSYSLTNVNWTDASIRTDITLPTGDVVTNTMPVTAVPYALYADGAGGNLDQVQSDWTETNTASKAYIQNKPAIPTSVGQLTNDVHYITVNEVPVQVQSDWAETNTASTAYIQNKPAIPTSVGQLTNDVHYITVNEVPVQVQSDWAETNTASTAYIQNKPTIPTSVGQLTNDVHYITVNEVPVQVQSDWAETNTASTAYIQNKPAIPVVHNATLTLRQGNTTLGTFTANASTDQEIEIPTQAIPDQVNADWNATDGPAKILNKPTIPTVPTSVSAFQNDAGYLTSYTETDPQFNAWDKDYNDLTNKPTIPTVPTSVSAFQNDAGYLTSYTETDPQFNAWDKDYNDLTNKPTIPTVPTNVSAFQNDAGYLTSYTETDPQFNAWDKDYNDLTNKPTIPTVPTSVSAFQNDAGYLTSYTETDPQFNAWDKDYNDLTNKPAIPTVPTNVSAFQNDAQYVTQTQLDNAGYITGYTETDPQFNAWNKDYNDLTNKPNIPVVNNATLTLKQGNTTLGTFTANASTDQEIEIPTQAIPDQVKSDWNATTGPAEILNKPTIPTVPTNVSAFQNDAHYITVNEVPVQVQSDWSETNTASKAYIQNKPNIPTAVSQLTNDVHYITVTQVPEQVKSDWNATSGAAEILNKPTIPTVPTNVSAFTNDANYITINQVPAQVQSNWAETNTASTAYIQNKPAIPVVNNATLTLKQGGTTLGTFTANASTDQEIVIPTQAIPDQVNADWNATSGPAQILNKPTIPTVPTNVSAFQNDAHYVTQTQMESTGYLTRDSIVALQQTVNNLVALVNSLNIRMTQEQFTTTAGQTVFTLQHAPKQDCIIRCYVNGLMVGGNHNGVLDVNTNNNMQVEYSASFNHNYVLKANDKVTIVYWY